MELYSNHPDFYGLPIRLDAKQKQEPIKVINDFFSNQQLFEVRQILWEMVENGLTNDNYFFKEPKERRALLHFYEELELLLEDCLLMGDLGKRINKPQNE